MRLKTKVVLALSGVILAVGLLYLVLLGVLVSNTSDVLNDALRARSSARAATLSARLAFPLAADLTDEVERVLVSSHAEGRRQAAIAVVDRAHRKIAEAGVVPDDVLSQAVPIMGSGQAGELLRADMVVAIAPCVPDGEGGDAVGYVVYAESLRPFLELRKRALLLAILAIALGLGVAAAVGARQLSRAVRPIGDLARRMDELAATIAVRLPERTVEPPARTGRETSEVAALSRAFVELEGAVMAANAMDADLRASRDALSVQAVDLAAARDAALASARAKSQFLANMSHEIRTPMNGVIGMAELLRATPLDDDQRSFVEAIRRSGEDLLTVINDILDISKIEAGRLQLVATEFAPREAIEDVLHLLAERAARKGLDLAADVAEDVPERATGDPVRLRQVLSNLVANAVKFTERGEVVVSVGTAPGGRLHFAVRDTGIGIPKEAQAELFQPFVQVDGSLARRHGGTGLGLAISKELVALMGGEIGCQSAPESGSTFWFTVGLQGWKSASGQPDALRRCVHGLRVLAVDDNETNRAVIGHQLRRIGMDVEEASGGVAALRMLLAARESGRRFDLVLTDLRMPEMDGLTFVRRARETGGLGGAAVVALASVTDPPHEELTALGVAGVLVKPVREAELRSVLARVLATPASPRPAGPHAPAPVQAPDVVDGPLVLVAEDNLVNQQLARELLRRFGYRVEVVGDGSAAVERAVDGRYALVLMDCQMPRMDGLTATQRIRERESGHVPIVAMTAQAMQGDREACVASGMDDYLSKPIQIDALRDVLQRYAPLPRARVAAPVSAPATATAPPPAAPRAASGPFDEELLLARCMGDRDLVARLLTTFEQTAEGAVRDLQRHLARGDSPAAAGAAHALKGAAGNLAAGGLHALAQRLEALARGGFLEEAGTVVAQLEAELQRCLERAPRLAAATEPPADALLPLLRDMGGME